MTRRLFIHIGMHKTGSTAIQVTLKQYDDGTTAYLKLDHPNHSYGMVMLFCPEQVTDIVERSWVRSHAEFAQRADDNRRRAQAQVSGSHKHLIISGEELSDRFGAREIGRLQDFFGPFFDEIRVIAYLRAPHAYMASALQEILKTRACTPSEPPFPDYLVRLSPWEDAFGRDAIDYVLYHRDTLAGHDVITDFTARTGLTIENPGRKQFNKSMSAEAFAMLYRLRNGPGVSRLAWPAERIAEAARKCPEFGTRRFALATSIWPDFTAGQIASIAWAEDRLGRKFLTETHAEDAVVFRSEAEILSFAAAQDAAIRDWSRQIMPLRTVIKRRAKALFAPG